MKGAFFVREIEKMIAGMGLVVVGTIWPVWFFGLRDLDWVLACRKYPESSLLFMLPVVIREWRWRWPQREAEKFEHGLKWGRV